MSASRWFRAAFVIGALCAATPLPLAAQQPAEDKAVPNVRAGEAGIELDFQDAELRTVVSSLAELAGLNVLYGNLPDTRVTLRTNAPVTTAEIRNFLEGVAESNNLLLVEEGGFVRIAPRDPSRGSEQASPDDQDQSTAPRLFVYRLKHAQAGQIARTLGSVFGGGSVAGGTNRGLSRRGLSEELNSQRVGESGSDRAAADSPSPEGGGQSEDPSLSASVGLVAQLEGEIRIVPDAPTNSLLIHALPGDFQTVSTAIEELDARPLQVLIEILIAEVRRDGTIGLGTSAVLEGEPSDDVSLTGELSGLSAGDLILGVLSLGPVRIDAVLAMLASSSDVTVLSRPVVIAQNNEEARILVGSQRPFIQVSRTLPTDQSVRDQVVQFRDVGTQLTILPTINPDGYVSLSVLQEVSNATSEVQFDAPVISTREVSTKLLVKDGHTVILGGLVENQKETSRSGIPLLKDIPLLGGLFGSSQTRNVSTELLLFLTPHVIRSDDEMEDATEGMREATQHLRKRLQNPLSILGEDIADRGEKPSANGGAGDADSGPANDTAAGATPAELH